VSHVRSYVHDERATDEVALIVASHSRAIADGVADLVRQVAPDVPIVSVGGAPDGTLGTDVGQMLAALRSVLHRRDAVVLVDIGSSVLTARTAISMLDPPERTWALVADAPLVEGAIAAGVAAAAGAAAAEVVAAAELVRALPKL
jgi:phosphoenolpyruvate---glycerone phosphotransferase subunit DhaM